MSTVPVFSAHSQAMPQYQIWSKSGQNLIKISQICKSRDIPWISPGYPGDILESVSFFCRFWCKPGCILSEISFFVNCGANQAAFCRRSHFFVHFGANQAAFCRISSFFVHFGSRVRSHSALQTRQGPPGPWRSVGQPKCAFVRYSL